MKCIRHVKVIGSSVYTSWLCYGYPPFFPVTIPDQEGQTPRSFLWIQCIPFFQVFQHLLCHGASVYNGHLWGSVTLTRVPSVWRWSYHYLFERLCVSVVNGDRILISRKWGKRSTSEPSRRCYGVCLYILQRIGLAQEIPVKSTLNLYKNKFVF